MKTLYSVPLLTKFLYALALITFMVALLAGCGGGGGPSFTYTPIANVPQAVNDLGKMICQEQRNVVTPGGDEWSPGFSWVDKSNFDSSDKLTKITNKVKSSGTFSAGVASIRTLSASDQARVFSAYQTPLYPTWAMNGHIGSDGTTDAGYQAEGEIATALTNAVRSAL